MRTLYQIILLLELKLADFVCLLTNSLELFFHFLFFRSVCHLFDIAVAVSEFDNSIDKKKLEGLQDLIKKL